MSHRCIFTLPLSMDAQTSFDRFICGVRRVKVTENENGITNGIDIFQARGSGPHIVASNNDAVLRVYDASAAALKCVRCAVLHGSSVSLRMPPGSHLPMPQACQVVCEAKGR